MRSVELDRERGHRTFAVVFDPGEEAAAGLLAFTHERALASASFTGIGALERVTLGFWDPDTREYRPIAVREQVEVLALTGNVALDSDGAPKVHAHVVVGKADGTACGGHLLEAWVRPTLEVIVVESPRHLRRTIDPRTGLALLDPDATR